MDQIQDQEPDPQQTITLPDTSHRRQLPPPKKCPRCSSSNIKFRYYNNNSLLQPRYLCKGCERDWTHGGAIRNVPIGGRKNKRPKISSSSGSSSEIVTRSQLIPDVHFTGLDLELRLGFNVGTNNNNTINNTNSSYTGGAILPVMQGINKPQVGRFGGNVALQSGINVSSLRRF